MKKYLFSCISVKPIYYILVSLSILRPDLVFAGASPTDTAFYYNERGRLLWRDMHALKRGSYIIRTKKTAPEIFHDVPMDDSTIQLSDGYNTATVINIPKPVARKVARLIKHGKLTDPLVQQNIIPVLDKRTLRRMYENILVRCTGIDSRHQEHGGVVYPDGTVTCISGALSDPRWLQGATLTIKQKALVYYHSHPQGYVEHAVSGNRDQLHQHNRVAFSQTSQTRYINYVQGPSRQDQEAVGEGTGYVFGISSSGFIYMYDKEGVLATLPVRFVKRMGPLPGRKEKKMETYFAGIFPAWRFNHIF
ncbi:hypothetical protein [Longitalea luteola]|uniref:hypothetical protein n=1 Tax=Longitalea luteola TaxID=2812563 RepID=UPI001A9628EC|nr:hypothetical protein [Longitalea luteola]